MISEQSALEQVEAYMRIVEDHVNRAQTESLEAKSQVTDEDIVRLVNNTIRERGVLNILIHMGIIIC